LDDLDKRASGRALPVAERHLPKLAEDRAEIRRQQRPVEPQPAGRTDACGPGERAENAAPASLMATMTLGSPPWMGGVVSASHAAGMPLRRNRKPRARRG